MDWARWQQFYPAMSQLPWLSPVLPSAQGHTAIGLAPLSPDTLQSMSPTERQQTVISFVKEQVAQVLGLPATAVDAHKPLIYLGMDSLMAVELRIRLDKGLNNSISTVDLIGGFSVADIGAKLLAPYAKANDVLKSDDQDHRVRDQERENVEALLTQIENLSEEEVRTLLGERQ
jgi:hypothetical protein